MSLIPPMTQEQMQEAIVEAHMELEELRQTVLKFADTTATAITKTLDHIKRLETKTQRGFDALERKT